MPRRKPSPAPPPDPRLADLLDTVGAVTSQSLAELCRAPGEAVGLPFAIASAWLHGFMVALRLYEQDPGSVPSLLAAIKADGYFGGAYRAADGPEATFTRDLLVGTVARGSARYDA